MKAKAVCLFSGGMDSLMAVLRVKDRYDCRLLTYDYGQRNKREIKQAIRLSEALGLPHSIQHIGGIFEHSTSGLLQKEGNIWQENETTGMGASFVPNRNLLFLTLAWNYAASIGADYVVFGVDLHPDSYPDARKEFVVEAQKFLNLCSQDFVQIITPLAGTVRADSFAWAEENGWLEMVLGETHTCYNNTTQMNEWGVGCGDCPTCHNRMEHYERYRQQRTGE